MLRSLVGSEMCIRDRACMCVLWTVCGPCLCCAYQCAPWSRCELRTDACVRPPKPAMPSPRRRALTIPLDHQKDQHTSSQTRSAFMNRLPLEIRRMVYERALGGASIHMQLWEAQLVARRCGSKGECQCKTSLIHQENKLDFALSLLRTCRHM